MFRILFFFLILPSFALAEDQCSQGDHNYSKWLLPELVSSFADNLPEVLQFAGPVERAPGKYWPLVSYQWEFGSKEATTFITLKSGKILAIRRTALSTQPGSRATYSLQEVSSQPERRTDHAFATALLHVLILQPRDFAALAAKSNWFPLRLSRWDTTTPMAPRAPCPQSNTITIGGRMCTDNGDCSRGGGTLTFYWRTWFLDDWIVNDEKIETRLELAVED